MVILEKITVGGGRRPAWFGMLFLVMIIAAVATVSFLPAQSDNAVDNNPEICDVSSTADFDDVMNYINGSGSGTFFTIVLNNDISILAEYTLNAGKVVTLTSSPGETFKLIKTMNSRHFLLNGSLTLDNIILDGSRPPGNTAGGSKMGGGIYVNPGGTLTMNSGSVIQNCYYSGGGGGGVGNAGTFVMNGGKIINNASNSSYGGGGVYNSYSTFIMKDGLISGNTAIGGPGGGVYNSAKTGYNCMFTMEGGEISGNTTGTFGGGVLLQAGFPFVMNGGVISGNSAKNGGGVCSNTGAGIFTMNGGEISGNTVSVNGGGVYVVNNDSFIMNGGVISGNTAVLGGGVYNAGIVTIAGGEIRDNKANGMDPVGSSGGGIYTTDYTKLTVIPADGKEVIFTGNTAPTLRTGNIDDDSVYIQKIGDAVVLDAWASGPVNKNAPAYNNFDINSPGDAYVVLIFITPNGGGTVTVTDSSSEEPIAFAADGSFYVPAATAGSIALSPESEGGYDFTEFVDGITKAIIADPANVQIKGNMKVFAEFKQNEYTITAESDNNSVIDPSGDTVVLGGEDMTFTFSAESGYKITAVYVDGVAISSEEAASGEYTFTKVIGDRTIEVISEAVVEPGSGGNGNSGTGSGNGTGTGGHGTGSGGSGNSSAGSNGGVTDVGGSGDIETGSDPNENENAGVTPVVTEIGDWSVLSMIFAVIAIFTGMIALVAGRDRFRTDNEERRSKTGITLRIIALIIGIASIIMLFVTEYGSAAPVAVGTWTPLMFVLLLATLVLAMVSFRFDKVDN